MAEAETAAAVPEAAALPIGMAPEVAAAAAAAVPEMAVALLATATYTHE